MCITKISLLSCIVVKRKDCIDEFFVVIEAIRTVLFIYLMLLLFSIIDLKNQSRH